MWRYESRPDGGESYLFERVSEFTDVAFEEVAGFFFESVESVFIMLSVVYWLGT